MRGKRTLWMVVLAVLLAVPALAQGKGRIEGKVAREDGRGIGGVTVVVGELGRVEITDRTGGFHFDGVPAGAYNLSFSLGDNASAQSVEVTADATTAVEETVDWDVSFTETITVYSASRRRERIAEAPAAVTVITQEQIEREASHGQLPKLLEQSPGAEVTQSGLYDFNFNSRGFNSSLNRRVKVLLDGRDPSVTFLSSQEWSSLTIPLDEVANVEMVRGPGSALYGADAYNGVINVTTKSPSESVGGRLKLTAGDLSTGRVDLSVSGGLGGDWYGRLVGGYLESDDFAVSRNVTTEYPGLDLEPIPLPQDQNQGVWGNVRIDKNLSAGQSLSLEAGYSEFESGGTAITGIGRTQFDVSERSHLRANYNTEHWNFLAYRNDRESPVTALRSGAPLFLDSDVTHGEIQGNVSFARGKGRLVGGASYTEENFDSTLPGVGVQTLVFEPVKADYEGVYGQLEYNFTDRLRGVVSARYDESNLWDSQFSPRAALVFAATPEHTFRVSYGEAFQSPNYSEFFLQVPVALPLTALAPLEGLFCAPFGVQCGLDSVPILALGNPTVEVEEVETFEIGYTGILGRKAYLTIDYYNSGLTNFLTDLISPFQPGLGFLNPVFGPFVAPAGIPAPFAGILETNVRTATPTMTNHPLTGLAILNGATYTNFGDVDTQGIELGLNVNLTDEWKLDLVYNWFDFEVKDQLAADPLLANSPENQYGLSLSYVGDKYDVSAKYRHVDGFDWAAGVFRGPILAYDLIDLSAGYRINDRVAIGLNVSNVLDESHYQIFGGDLLERRALGHVQFSW